jgi:RNA polymerase sigma-70 factor (ECF subfamily)
MTAEPEQKRSSSYVTAQEDEPDLIRCAQQGDDDAFGELVRRYQARLRGFASRYVDSSHDVFEIVQDAFLNAYRHLDRFDTTRAFYPWLRVICHNLILNFFRARRRTRNVNLQLVDDALLERLAAAGDDEDVTDEARVQVLRECLDRLAKSQRELIRTRYHGGVAVKDIAESFDATATSISMRLGRIRKKLRKCMTERLQQPVA